MAVAETKTLPRVERDQPEARPREALDPGERDKDSGGKPDGKEEGGTGDSPDDERQGRRRTWLIRTVFLLVLVAAAIGATIYWLSTRGTESTDDAYTDGRAVSIAPRVSGYVVELLVDDNQFVHKGDVLIRVDPRDYAAAREQAAGTLAIAKGQLAGSVAALERAKVTFPAQLVAAQGNLATTQGNLFRAQTDYRRQHGISKDATTQESVDASTAALRQAEGQVKQAEAQVTQATPVPQNIDEAAAQRDQISGQVQQAGAQLVQADLNLGYTVVRAPQDGWVTRRNVEVGSYAQPGSTIMSLVSPDVWVTANFKEDQLDLMRAGQKVAISVDAYGGLKLQGHVDSVQRGSGSRFSAFPAENATGNFVKIVQRVPVKIIIDSGLDPKIPLPLGISVEPTVMVSGATPSGR